MYEAGLASHCELVVFRGQLQVLAVATLFEMGSLSLVDELLGNLWSLLPFLP